MAGQGRVSEIVTRQDLSFLIESLDDKVCRNEKWENVIDKSNLILSYSAKCCKPQDGGPLKYLSTTVFEDCSPELCDQTNGVEIGRTVKKFTLLTPREYVLAWRLWEGKDKTFYCFVKECEHHSAPRQRRYVRVGHYRSGWRIRKVPGRNACEIKMIHQEDAGLNVEMAKLAFAKGIWSYVCKMDNALRKYNPGPVQRSPFVTAVTLIQKVPSELELKNMMDSTITTPALSIDDCTHVSAGKEKKFLKKPSKLVLANGLLLIGGVICLTRGHSSLGAKVAIAYVLTKLNNRGVPSSQSRQN
ncbi:uncharacterized protein [Rutidosis leptorrhynchoides]|uniref:uncharacterized protein n=1 Tax=Rutidosis leptorrhynchoides TaxID=125765 RepID=UPI003A991FBC